MLFFPHRIATLPNIEGPERSPARFWRATMGVGGREAPWRGFPRRAHPQPGRRKSAHTFARARFAGVKVPAVHIPVFESRATLRSFIGGFAAERRDNIGRRPSLMAAAGCCNEREALNLRERGPHECRPTDAG